MTVSPQPAIAAVAPVITGAPASTAAAARSDGTSFAATLGSALAPNADTHAGGGAGGVTRAQATAARARPMTAGSATSAPAPAPSGNASLAGRRAATRRPEERDAADCDDPQSAQLAMLLGVPSAMLAAGDATADVRGGNSGVHASGATAATDVSSGDSTQVSQPSAGPARMGNHSRDADPIRGGRDAAQPARDGAAVDPGTSLATQTGAAAAADLSARVGIDASAASASDAKTRPALLPDAPSLAQQRAPLTSAQSAAADQALRDAAAAASSPAGETTAAPLQGWNTEPQSLGREVLGAGAGSARMRGDGRLPASARAALPAPGHDDPGTSPAQGMPLAPTLASDQRPREKNAASGSIAMSQADSVAAAAVAPDAPSTPSSDAAGAPGPHIVAPAVGSPDWAAAIAQHLARAAGSRDIELHLNPQELGPLKVKLSLLAGQAQLAFVSEHLPVRQALEAALPQLRSSLADSGISLGQATVASGTGDAMPDHGAGRQQPAPDRGWRSGRPAAPPPAPVRRGSSAVDTFA